MICNVCYCVKNLIFGAKDSKDRCCTSRWGEHVSELGWITTHLAASWRRFRYFLIPLMELSTLLREQKNRGAYYIRVGLPWKKWATLVLQTWQVKDSFFLALATWLCSKGSRKLIRHRLYISLDRHRNVDMNVQPLCGPFYFFLLLYYD